MKIYLNDEVGGEDNRWTFLPRVHGVVGVKVMDLHPSIWRRRNHRKQGGGVKLEMEKWGRNFIFGGGNEFQVLSVYRLSATSQMGRFVCRNDCTVNEKGGREGLPKSH